MTNYGNKYLLRELKNQKAHYLQIINNIENQNKALSKHIVVVNKQLEKFKGNLLKAIIEFIKFRRGNVLYQPKE